jgi:hypothetical protein
MATVTVQQHRAATALALVVVGIALVAGSAPASAQVTAVRGNAYGYSFSVSLFGGAPGGGGPTPTVTLAPDASNSPQTATAPTASAAIDPATFFTSGQVNVRTEGSTGANGSVTSSVNIQGVNSSGQEAFTASAVASTCSASQAAAPTGSVTVTNGTLQTDNGDSNPANSIPDHPPVTVSVPANPAPNTVIEGHLHLGNVTDMFRYIFNEQVVNADGSISVNAFHEKLLGPTAVGDLIVGHVECGVTPAVSTTSSTAAGATTTTAPGSTSTTGPATTSTTAATTTTTTTTTSTAPTTTTATSATSTPAAGIDATAGAQTVSDVSGGAFGFSVSISLFGGPPGTRGPTPTVTLPAGGSSTPVTSSDPSANATFGPAVIFTSDRLDVSTQGTPGPSGSVTSSATVTNTNKSGQEEFTAASIASSCTASASGVSGSTTVSGGKLITSEGNPDVDGDEVSVDVPSSPAANTSINGTVESVGDHFRVVFNEQQTSGRSITVNAMHMYLLGPTAVGDLIVGQSRCSLTASGSSGGGTSGGTGTTASGSGGSGLASTGTEAGIAALVALALIGAGWNTTLFARWRRGPSAGAAVLLEASASSGQRSTQRRGGRLSRMTRQWISRPPS